MRTKIAKVMDLRGVGNKDLARAFGVSDITICGWRRGRVAVPPGRRKQLADALGVKVEDILDARGVALLAEEAEIG